MIRIQREAFDPAAETAKLLGKSRGAGGLVTFVGIVRSASDRGSVDWLELEHYPRMAELTFGKIAQDAVARFALIDIAIVHRFGRLAPGEGIVFVGAASAHRRSAFEATDYIMDRLKVEAPFWKKEVGADFATWVEPRSGDVADRLRWKDGLSE